MGDGEDDGGDEVYKGSAEPVLISFSDSYSNEDSFLVGDNRPFSCPVYAVY